MRLVIRWKRDAARFPAVCALALVVLAGGALMRMTIKERIDEQRATATALAALSGSRIAQVIASGTGAEMCARESSTLTPIVRAVDATQLASSGFDYELSCATPDARQPRVIARSVERGLVAPVRHASYGNASVWTIALAPAAGWVPWGLIGLQSLLVFVTALFAVLATTELARRPEQLRVEVRARDRRLKEVHQRLAAEIQRREALESQASQASPPDAMTGVANRRYLTDRITRALQHPAESVAVIAIGFDRLTQTNNGRWRWAADELLLQAMQRVKDGLGSREHAIARVADDVVGLLLLGVSSGESARVEAESLRQAFSTALTIGGQRVLVNANLGIALGGSEYEGADELLDGAQTALARAAADAGTRIAVFDPATRDQIVTGAPSVTLRRALR